ncbi:hypothetical protein [Nostoc sp. NMS4]|uniref:hypothetical protein n=1 Tax=Nostoc sp. NMS4 TaxID=2815390 RepID=UPI0025F1C72C|nr:hypothetical protein [Nostoc sp. NMS4]MBN3927517.1 hypothetical protein [Nostoc sp. NMS4]
MKQDRAIALGVSPSNPSLISHLQLGSIRVRYAQCQASGLSLSKNSPINNPGVCDESWHERLFV